ncbi:unnamed protein product [marine sediment metagenome]|uniref:Uncharacterized protein n=1 Tax=marine sediment metagenome TaxID=412755 RepID=X1AKA6_9ZZZZ
MIRSPIYHVSSFISPSGTGVFIQFTYPWLRVSDPSIGVASTPKISLTVTSVKFEVPSFQTVIIS